MQRTQTDIYNLSKPNNRIHVRLTKTLLVRLINAFHICLINALHIIQPDASAIPHPIHLLNQGLHRAHESLERTQAVIVLRTSSDPGERYRRVIEYDPDLF